MPAALQLQLVSMAIIATSAFVLSAATSGATATATATVSLVDRRGAAGSVSPDLAATAAAVPGPNPVVAVHTGSSDWNMGYTLTQAEAGISWYTHVWKIFPNGLAQDWGIGMPGTWLHGNYQPKAFKDVCACNPNGWPSNPAVNVPG